MTNAKDKFGSDEKLSVREQVGHVVRETMMFESDREIRPSDTFVGMGMDSLEIVECVMGLEEEFGVDLPDEVVAEWKTMADVYAWAEKLP